MSTQKFFRWSLLSSKLKSPFAPWDTSAHWMTLAPHFYSKAWSAELPSAPKSMHIVRDGHVFQECHSCEGKGGQQW
eukprot:113441-Pyramimonas_sp.AAC.1